MTTTEPTVTLSADDAAAIEADLRELAATKRALGWEQGARRVEARAEHLSIVRLAAVKNAGPAPGTEEVKVSDVQPGDRVVISDDEERPLWVLDVVAIQEDDSAVCLQVTHGDGKPLPYLFHWGETITRYVRAETPA